MTQINAGHIENLTIHEAPPGAPEVAPPEPPLPDPGRRRMALGSALFSLGLVAAQNPDTVMQILGLFGK
jgi:hypothetical protein